MIQQWQLTDPMLHWTLIMAAILVVFSVRWVAPRFGAVPAVSLFFFCASALWVWQFRDNQYLNINPYDQMALRFFAADSIAKIMIICVPLMLLAADRFQYYLLGALLWGAFAVFNCLWVVIQYILGCGHNECGGALGNPSISLGATVCMLPVFVHSWRKQWFVMGIVALAVFASKSSVAVGLFAVYCAAWLFPWARIKELSWRTTLAPVAAAASVFLVGAYAQGASLLKDSDRFMIWQFMFDRWRAPWNIPFGTGLGTYHVFSINLQNREGFERIASHFHWNTLHNEPLQALFEGGVVGLLLFSLVYCLALTKSIREENKGIALSIVLFGLYMLMDPALHFPVPALFGAWLFVYALRREKFNLKEMV